MTSNLPLLDLSKPLRAPAKLNLFLSISGRRANGYHDLETVFQFIDLCDVLSFMPHASSKIELLGFEDRETENNLILKAALALKAQKPQRAVCGVCIHCHKKIPMGAGLGGGSSDAATTLIALNQLWDFNLSRAELMNIGKTLGADVPIFISGQSAFAQGIGDILTPIELPESYFYLIKPQESISTAMIFNHADLKRDRPKWQQFESLPRLFYNDCEPLVRALYPEIEAMLLALSKTHESRLTGTGSAFFACCQTHANAQQLQRQFRQQFNPALYRDFIVKGVNRSPLFAEV